MRLDVQRITPDFALIEQTPSIAARILFGRTTVDRYAVRRGALWFDDQSGALLEPQLLAALSRSRS